jgi:hypothetical protein
MRSKTFVSLSSGCLRLFRKSCGLFLILAATYATSTAQAGPAPLTPEIDPNSVSGALALLASGIYLFTGSRRYKSRGQ